MTGEYEYIDPAGDTLEDLLDELGKREEVYGAALKEVLAWQLEQARGDQHISKSEMAARMGTSRPQVDRVLDPENVAVSIGTLDKAARSLGKNLRSSWSTLENSTVHLTRENRAFGKARCRDD